MCMNLHRNFGATPNAVLVLPTALYIPAFWVKFVIVMVWQKYANCCSPTLNTLISSSDLTFLLEFHCLTWYLKQHDPTNWYCERWWQKAGIWWKVERDKSWLRPKAACLLWHELEWMALAVLGTRLLQTYEDQMRNVFHTYGMEQWGKLSEHSRWTIWSINKGS